MSAGSCSESSLLTVSALQQRLLEALMPLPVENIPLEACLGRVLAGDVRARVDNPRFDNAAMDGIALDEAGVAATPGCFFLQGSSLAGDPALPPLQAGQAMRITTGARIPQGTASVVVQEQCRFTASQVEVMEQVRTGLNIRRKGEDFGVGQLLLAGGMRLLPRHLLLLASQGLDRVSVIRQPVVAVLSSGDELRQPGQALGDSGIYDSNRPYLLARLRQAGARVLDLGAIPDSLSASREALRQAAARADLVVCSGGVSVGQADWLKTAVEEQGDLLQWKVRLKPGKPVAWGRVGNAAFLGLPGNPVSTLVCAELFLIPAINRLSGLVRALPDFLHLPLAEDFRRKAGREEYVRGVLCRDMSPPTVRILGGQGSASLANLAQCEVLVRLPEPLASVPAGTFLEVLPL